MNKKYIVILVVISLIVLGIIFLAFKNNVVNQADDNSTITNNTPLATTTDSDTNPPATANETARTSTSTMQNTGQLFSKSPDYSKSYLIYPTANAAAKKALTGFDLTIKDLGNGATQVSLPTKTQTDEIQSFIVTSGQKVYFVEKSMGDDSLDTDRNLGDDYGIAVDANGFILK